jgi:hypothetical protein
VRLPTDAELQSMPISAALHALLAAQQRVILGLGRVEEPWDVRLQCAPLLSSPSPSSFVTPAHCMHVTPCAQHAASHTVPVEVPPWSPGAPSVREVLVGWSRTLHTARVRRAQCLPSKPAVWHLPHVHAASRTPLLSLLARSMRAPHRTLLSSRSLRAACRSVPQRVLRRPEATRVCRRKQAALRQTAPHKRAALFECSAGDAEHSAYARQRHAYLVGKISELRRKQKMLALRQDRQLGAVADRIEIEKRHMLMQLFDLEREEVRRPPRMHTHARAAPCTAPMHACACLHSSLTRRSLCRRGSACFCASWRTKGCRRRAPRAPLCSAQRKGRGLSPQRSKGGWRL